MSTVESMDSTVDMRHNSKTYDSDICDRRLSQIELFLWSTTHIQSLLLFLTITTQFQPLSPTFKQWLLFLWQTPHFQCSTPVLTIDVCFWQIACVFDHIWLLGTAFNCFHTLLVPRTPYQLSCNCFRPFWHVFHSTASVFVQNTHSQLPSTN